jgi:opacity protein-like surface antigen
MPRFAVATIAFALFLTASFALAQNPAPATPAPTPAAPESTSALDKFQVFAGFSLFHADTGGLGSAEFQMTLNARPGTLNVNTNFTGWNAEAQYNLSHAFAMAVDFNGRYGQPISSTNGSGISGLPKSSGYSFLLGPVFTHPLKHNVVPFVHALFGFDDFRWDAATIKGLTPSSTPAVSDTAGSYAAGGGVDYKLTPHCSYRIGQIDYFYTTHNLRQMYGQLFGAGYFQNLDGHQRNIRFSTGVVYRF